MFNNIIERLLGIKQTTQINHDGYYYSLLSPQQKTIYDAIFQCLNTYSRAADILSRPINEISDIYNSVLKDYPIFFYTTAFNISSSLMSSTATFRPDYKYDHSTVQRNKDQILQYLKRFDFLLNKSELEKEMYVHDYCLENFQYDYSFSEYSYTALGPILNKKAVCEGFAKFTKLIFDYLGVQNLIVSGKANNPAQNSKMEGHSWNIVMLQGKTYHLDITWDICVTGSAGVPPAKKSNNAGKMPALPVKRYDYLNLSDDDIKKDHIITEKVPPCTTKGQDYYTKNGMVANNPAELEKMIEKTLKQGQKHFIVRLNNVTDTNTIVNQILEIATQKYVNIMNSGVQTNIISNINQGVFEICFK